MSSRRTIIINDNKGEVNGCFNPVESISRKNIENEGLIVLNDFILNWLKILANSATIGRWRVKDEVSIISYVEVTYIGENNIVIPSNNTKTLFYYLIETNILFEDKKNWSTLITYSFVNILMSWSYFLQILLAANLVLYPQG